MAKECLALCAQAHGPEAAADLRRTADLLVEVDRVDEALTLMERVVGETREVATALRADLLLGYGRLLLLRGRAVEAYPVLREAHELARLGSQSAIMAPFLTFRALGITGRFDELERHAAEHLWFYAMLARLSLKERRRYVALLTMLEAAWSASGRTGQQQRTRALLSTQQRILERQCARRRAIRRGIMALTRVDAGNATRRRGNESPDLPAYPAAYAARLDAELAQVEECRRTGDAGALAEALARLAETRWQAGGQRSAALTTQREVLELTRRLTGPDQDELRQLLSQRLRRFAEWAEAIGVRSDAQAARAEADQLAAM